MQSTRYPYSPIIERPPLKWPGGARVALWICPNIECFHIDKPIARGDDSHLPDIQGYSLRDYGARVGVFRLMDVLDKYGIRASAVLNTDVCEQYPAIVREGKKRDWEWLGHGVTNHLRMHDYPEDKEREMIRQAKEMITAAVGKAPKGWLSPGLAETFCSPDHLAAEGFEYLCDWSCDDQPVPMRVRQGRMVVLPVHSRSAILCYSYARIARRRTTCVLSVISLTRFTRRAAQTVGSWHCRSIPSSSVCHFA